MRRHRLREVGTKNAKRRLRKNAGRECRFHKDVNHWSSKAVGRNALVSGKARALLDDLSGIRERVTVRHDQRYERHSWAFYHLRHFLSYKSAWAGVPLRLVDPRTTRRTCSAGGHGEQANRKRQEAFLCQRWGCALTADINAAITISRKEPYRAAVNQPLASPLAG